MPMRFPSGGLTAPLTMTQAPVHPRSSALLARLLLVALVLGVFSGLADHPFVTYDDDVYVYKNPHVSTGLSWGNLGRAFTSTQSSHWHPLAWISHMLDCELFGLNPAGHHLSSLFLHLLNVLLLFGLLFRATGGLWQSALAAALFAVHPLNVEPVAWVSSRKDLVSALFLLLALRAYIPYTERGGAGWYLAALSCFTLGLLAKSMVVTLPCLLILLDAWPLKRLPWGRSARETARPTLRAWVLEKTPFFALAILFGGAAVFIMKSDSESVAHAPFFDLLLQGDRLTRGLFMLVTYLRRVVWPSDLAVIYPPDQAIPFWAPLLGAGLLLGISGLALRQRKPVRVFGWFWFLATLLPLLGILNVGPRVPADRYAYIPLIGLFVLASWTGGALLSRLRERRFAACAAVALAILGLGIISRVQVEYWASSTALFQRTLHVTTGNAKAHNNLGNVLARKGRMEEAVRHFRSALDIRPQFAEAHNNLGLALVTVGRPGEAVSHFRQALEIDPDYGEVMNNWGIALAKLGRHDEAAALHRASLEKDPRSPEALNNLGNALVHLGDVEAAHDAYETALLLRPDYFEARKNLARLLTMQGRVEEAIPQYREALRLRPGRADVHFLLGETLARAERGPEAAAHFQRALAIHPGHAGAHYKLGSFLAATGRLREALPHFLQARDLRPDHAPTRLGLGLALLALGRTGEASKEAHRLARLKPGLADFLSREIARAVSSGGPDDAATRDVTITPSGPLLQPEDP